MPPAMWTAYFVACAMVLITAAAWALLAALVWLAVAKRSLAAAFAAGALALLLWSGPVVARDLGQWDAADPGLRSWYQHLMQPDHPQSSCCGEADAYWCDEIHVRQAKTFCTITDDRPDALLGRPHIAVGTEVEIPDAKLKWYRGNPTGHSVVFISSMKYVFCFVQGGGA